jgi:hypothetical protein
MATRVAWVVRLVRMTQGGHVDVATAQQRRRCCGFATRADV